MNKQQYEAAIAQEKEEAISRLLPHGGSGMITETRLRAAMDALVKRIATHTRAYELLSLKDSSELAAEWNVSGRRARAHIAMLHDRWGVGRRVGSAWMLSADEAESHRPAANAGRPKTSAG